MRKIVCTVNAGQVNDEHKKELQTALRSNYAKHLSASESLFIVWCELPTAQGYTCYEHPSASLFIIEAQAGLDQKHREQMLAACAADCSRITGIALGSLVFSVFDEPQFARMMSANQQRRLSLVGRIRFGYHMVVSLLRSKVTRGLWVFNANLGAS